MRRALGYLRDVDAITMNRDRLLCGRQGDWRWTACARATSRRSARAAIPRRRRRRARGARRWACTWPGAAGRIGDHDALIGRKLAWILAGGALPHATAVSEQHLLDLEREAFLSLCGEPKTLERIQHTLKTGKTLRN